MSLWGQGDSKQDYRHYYCPCAQAPRYLLPEPADGPSLRLSPSHLSTVTLEDLELLLTEGLVSAETSERDECSGRASGSLVPEQDTSKLWKQLEQW